jgi:MFS family permease
MAAGNLFGGMLVDRYGPRKLLAFGLLALAIGMLGVALTRSACSASTRGRQRQCSSSASAFT